MPGMSFSVALAVSSHQNTTLNAPVNRMLASARGTSHFQARPCSWSSRKRGKVQRNQIITKTSSEGLADQDHGPAKRGRPRDAG